MEAFGVKLSDGSIAGIVAYIRSSATPTTAGEALPPPSGKEPLFVNPHGKPPTSFKLTADPGGKPRYVSVDQVITLFHKNLGGVQKLIAGVVAEYVEDDSRPCRNALRAALVTAREHLTQEQRSIVDFLLV